MSREELETYEKYLMAKYDEIGALKIAEKRGIEIGEKKGKREASMEIAKQLLESGMPVDEIEKITGLSRKVFQPKF